MAWDSYDVSRWKHKFGFHNRRVHWDTPKAKWAGAANDYQADVATAASEGRRNTGRKEDVIHSLPSIASVREAVKKKVCVIKEAEEMLLR